MPKFIRYAIIMNIINGQVFVAIVNLFSALPNFEMKEIRTFIELPTNLTYFQSCPCAF